MIDAAWSLADGKLMMVLLDWRKAFDRVSGEAMLSALRRFGLPPDIVKMIHGIYTDRVFSVSDAGQESKPRVQGSGISQGCPLSPYLFIILMTVLCHDVDTQLASEFGPPATPYVVTRDILYADDTLLAETRPDILQRHLDLIVEYGASYGLEIHWGKTLLLQARQSGTIHGGEGPLKPVDSTVYLGGLLSADGLPTRELTRRLGEAETTFKKLQRVWRHTNIPKQRKHEIYVACVVSKLLTGLETTWLRKRERARLDAYHVRCLRRIQNVAPSYYSRVPNKDVLLAARSQAMSNTLLCRQLVQFGKIARMGDSALERQLLFQPGSVLPNVWPGKRPRGRPRQNWVSCVHAHAIEAAGGPGGLARLVGPDGTEQAWKATVRSYCLTASFS